MTWTKRLLTSALCSALALLGTAYGQTATQNLPFNSGTFSGALGGSITADIKNTSSANIDISTLRIRTVKGGGLINAFPNSDTTVNPAPIPIAITPSQVGINIPSTPFSSPITGSMDVTAGDNLANAIPGVLDGGVPGSDGKWDDPLSTGILNNATASNITLGITNPISATANVTGGINASIPNNITIPNVVSASPVFADFIIKNTSTLSVNFDPVQSISLSGLSISAPTPIALNVPGTGNFVDGFHPVPGASATLDLSATGANLVSTTISGNLIADLTGSITGSIDLAANIRLVILGININLSTINLDNAVDGVLGSGSLIDLNEQISLDDTELPFLINVIHEANTDVDFDDVAASLLSGSLGLTVPINLTETGLELDIPATPFSIGPLAPIAVSGTGYSGNVILQTLAGAIGGNIDLDLIADLELQADVVANAFKASAINVVPEPGSVLLMAFAGLGLVGYGIRRRRK